MNNFTKETGYSTHNLMIAIDVLTHRINSYARVIANAGVPGTKEEDWALHVVRSQHFMSMIDERDRMQDEYNQRREQARYRQSI